MKRSGEVLRNQTEDFLEGLARFRSYGVINKIDPLFEKFLEQECGVNLAKLNEAIGYANEVARYLTNKNGIVTNENCQKFVDNQETDPMTDMLAVHGLEN